MGITPKEDHLRKGSDVSPLEALVAGSMAGAVSRAITAPLDTIKIRLQLQSHTSYSEYKGATQTLTSLLRNEGVKALWKGNVPAEILYIFYGGIQFTSYSIFSRALSELEQNNKYKVSLSPAVHSLVVGSGAGLTSTFFTYPFDLLRTRLAANSDKKFLSLSSTVVDIWEKQGIRGFFAGFRPTALSVASTTGLMFWAYSEARELSARYKDNIPFIEGICGFLAGAISKGITFPLDTLRKRMQMYHVNHGTSPSSALRLCSSIIRNEGLFGFYKGYGMSVLKTAPTSALSLFMYEYTLTFIRRS
ncbi:mitochondrial thiamine pyrophosphate carrier 1 [[Candida] railenensis]|uniref:Mitochondrial thiamine pyrophosphate carrier 1 n=1 Tax=[Candida] railenensis TaxID=45579 RepID=A0A9P0QQ23_9ASCO|nr:mitochondrial thiamine pyrophosphate carrier 1 [[Candida] railenensis]